MSGKTPDMRGTASETTALEAVPWTRYVGAWLAIGSSPGALVLGAQLVAGHGQLSIAWLGLSALLVAVLLALQGQLGLLPPRGEGTTFAAMSRSYLPPPSRTAVGVLIAAGMVGWVGFSVGIGAESLSRVLGAPHTACAAGLGVAVLVLATRDIRRWNVVAIATTALTLSLAPLLLLGVDRVEVPVTSTVTSGPQGVVVLAAFIGYAAVFLLRSPDFTAGIARRSGLFLCIAALVAPALMLMLVGGALQLSAGSAADVSLAGVPGMRVLGLPVGDMLIVVAILAPAVAASFSGGLALQALSGVAARVGTCVVAALGLTLGLLEFHRELVDWLAFLAGVAPPIAVPFWVEGARRRRGRSPRLIPIGVWLPPAVAGGLLITLGVTAAPLIALAAAAVLSGAWGRAPLRHPH